MEEEWLGTLRSSRTRTAHGLITFVANIRSLDNGCTDSGIYTNERGLRARVVKAEKEKYMKIGNVFSKLSTAAVIAGLALTLSTGFAHAQDGAKQDMKDAGHETKEATKDAGRGIARGTKKGYHKTKHGLKRAGHKVHDTVDPT